jgi:hypothetical protein
MSVTDIRREMQTVFKDRASIKSVTLADQILTVEVLVKGDTTPTVFTKRIGPNVSLSDGLPSWIAQEIIDARQMADTTPAATHLPEITKVVRPNGKFAKRVR